MSDPLELEPQFMSCWELNVGPLENQPVLLIVEPYLQPY